jgi:hypothetical protein
MRLRLFLIVAFSVLSLSASAIRPNPSEYVKPLPPLPEMEASEVHIHLVNDSEVTINLGDTVIAEFGWWACSRGLTLDARRASTIRVVLKEGGTAIQRVRGSEAKAAWSAPYLDPLGETANCFWPVDEMAAVWWSYDGLVFDHEGDFNLRFYWDLKTPIIDGWADETGPFWYDSGYLYDNLVTVHVVNP